jgi:lipopolysaccharide transport system permease protein
VRGVGTVLEGVPQTDARSEMGEAREVVIQHTRGWRFLDLRELWDYRELVYFLIWRDIKVRYKQTAIGIAWAVVQPLAMMLVFTLIFGRLARIPSSGVPYPLFAYAALLPWQLFSRSILESTNSLVVNQQLVSRVYFPRVSVPLSTVLAASVDFAIGAGLLAVLMAVYRVAPTPAAVWLPGFVLLLLITGLGVGFWLSALNIEYRDVMYTMPFLNQFWFFLTPVVYPGDLIPSRWQTLYGLNPMTGVVEGFRWALLGTGEAPTHMLALSAFIALVLFVTGIIWFRHRERTFVDVIGSGGR